MKGIGMKTKTTYICSECGYKSPKWLGKCPGCNSWNTIQETVITEKKTSATRAMSISNGGSVRMPKKIGDVKVGYETRYKTGLQELDRVLGGGIVQGELILVGGDPGIGKSTLLLLVCRNMSNNGKKILYISGEESLKQIKLRANRMGQFSDNLSLLSETSLDIIESVILETKPDAVVIGSAPGSVSQVRESTNFLMQLAKGNTIPIFIVGHVTKEGVVAGPRVLEHMVDTVLYFEGDRHAAYRIIRGVKNRFGSTNEIGVFEMMDKGLAEVENPSEYMLNGRAEEASGSVVVCLIEGTRPLLVEIQALVCDSNFGLPRRTAAGTDYNRVNLLMAVLEKRAGIHMSGSDAYVNIAGGIKVNEPALDLGLVMALVSSYKNRPVSDKTIIFGEVGLAGEVRAVCLPIVVGSKCSANLIEQRADQLPIQLIPDKLTQIHIGRVSFYLFYHSSVLSEEFFAH